MNESDFMKLTGLSGWLGEQGGSTYALAVDYMGNTVESICESYGED